MTATALGRRRRRKVTQFRTVSHDVQDHDWVSSHSIKKGGSGAGSIRREGGREGMRPQESRQELDAEGDLHT